MKDVMIVDSFKHDILHRLRLIIVYKEIGVRKSRLGFASAFYLMSIAWMSLPASAAIIGDPSVDPGWTAIGSSTDSNLYVDGTGAFQATIYTTAFNLSAGSPLISTTGGFDWNAGDVIVGVGGVMVQTADLTYGGDADEFGVSHTGSTSARIVVKYGSSGATWTAPGTGSLANGGVGSIILGTPSYDFYPADSGTLIVPDSSPLEQSTVNTTTPISGLVGRVVTNWTGASGSMTLNGYESFMDLTLLQAQYPSATAALGNPFVMDLQRGTGAYQDSLGALPSSVPEPNLAAFGVFFALAALSRRRITSQSTQSPHRGRRANLCTPSLP